MFSPVRSESENMSEADNEDGQPLMSDEDYFNESEEEDDVEDDKDDNQDGSSQRAKGT